MTRLITEEMRVAAGQILPGRTDDRKSVLEFLKRLAAFYPSATST